MGAKVLAADRNLDTIPTITRSISSSCVVVWNISHRRSNTGNLLSWKSILVDSGRSSLEPGRWVRST